MAAFDADEMTECATNPLSAQAHEAFAARNQYPCAWVLFDPKLLRIRLVKKEK